MTSFDIIKKIVLPIITLISFAGGVGVFAIYNCLIVGGPVGVGGAAICGLLTLILGYFVVLDIKMILSK